MPEIHNVQVPPDYMYGWSRELAPFTLVFTCTQGESGKSTIGEIFSIGEILIRDLYRQLFPPFFKAEFLLRQLFPPIPKSAIFTYPAFSPMAKIAT